MGKNILRMEESATCVAKLYSCLTPYEELGMLNFEFATHIIKEKRNANTSACLTLQRSCQSLTLIFENNDDKQSCLKNIGPQIVTNLNNLNLETFDVIAKGKHSKIIKVFDYEDKEMYVLKKTSKQ